MFSKQRNQYFHRLLLKYDITIQVIDNENKMYFTSNTLKTFSITLQTRFCQKKWGLVGIVIFIIKQDELYPVKTRKLLLLLEVSNSRTFKSPNSAFNRNVFVLVCVQVGKFNSEIFYRCTRFFFYNWCALEEECSNGRWRYHRILFRHTVPRFSSFFMYLRVVPPLFILVFTIINSLKTCHNRFLVVVVLCHCIPF